MAGGTWNTGTSTAIGVTFTNSGTTVAAVRSKDFTIYNGGQDQLHISNPPGHVTVTREVQVKKDFWDGIKWGEHTSYMPRKSITGKIIIGKMHKRQKETIVKGVLQHKQYAKTKELFEEKLRGKA